MNSAGIVKIKGYCRKMDERSIIDVGNERRSGMYRLVSKLIIYRNIPKDSILLRLSDIFRRFDEGHYEADALTGEIFDVIHALLDLATTYGFDRNLWHNYLAFLLAMTETPFTLVSEKAGAIDGSVNHFAEQDFSVFRQLLDYDFSGIEEALGIDCFTVIRHYRAVCKEERIFNRSVSEKVQALSTEIGSASTRPSASAMTAAVLWSRSRPRVMCCFRT